MTLDIRFYMSLLMRRAPVMVALLLLCSGIGVAMALKLPPTFQAAARLLFEAPQIPDSMFVSTVQTGATEQLQVVEQRLMTRANLLDLANKYDVFEDDTDITPDEIVEEMQKNTQIRRSSGRGQATLMSIGFSANDPQIAADVVNEYVTLVLEENNRFRLSRTESTLSFFEQEAERLSVDLDTHSARIIAFKTEKAGALPRDLSFRQNRQSDLEERLASLLAEEAALTAQRAQTVDIFEETGAVRNGGTQQTLQRSASERQLEELQLQLSDARSVYSETNRRVTTLKARVETLEAKVQQEKLNNAGAGQPEENAPSAEQALLKINLSEIDQRLTQIADQSDRIRSELLELGTSISETSTNAIILDGLEREYENLQKNYDIALANLNTARISERVEVSAQGQRISVVESAIAPKTPSGPNKLKIIATGIAAGLGLAIGYFMLLEFLNRTVRRAAEIRSKFGIEPLVTIPYLENPRERMMRRMTTLSAVVFVLIAVPATMWYVDANYMPLDVLASRVLSRLGLA